MAWTSPRTWVSGELVTAALMNTYVRDNQNYLKTETDATTTFLASRNYTDTAVVMGRGTSPLASAFGFYGSTSAPTAKLQGSNPYFYLVNQLTTTGTWYSHVYPSGGATYYRIGNSETQANVIQWGNNGQQWSYTGSGTSVVYYNADASTAYVQMGQHGISPHGSTNEQDHLDDYEYGTYTPYLYGGTTGNTGDASYRISGVGSYVKVGRLVWVKFRFDNFTTPASATGYLAVTQPFANSGVNVLGAPMTQAMNFTAGDYTYAVVYAESSRFLVYDIGDNLSWAARAITIDSGAGHYLWMTGCYYTAV